MTDTNEYILLQRESLEQGIIPRIVLVDAGICHESFWVP